MPRMNDAQRERPVVESGGVKLVSSWQPGAGAGAGAVSAYEALIVIGLQRMEGCDNGLLRGLVASDGFPGPVS